MLALLPFLLVGCAQNSIFELTMMTPPPEGGRDRVVVEGRLGAADFDADWQQTQISGITLEPGVPNTFVVSFEASGEDLAEQLLVKVRFCIEERCRDVMDGNAPEQRYTFERVFYQGRYTLHDETIDMYPGPMAPAEVAVDKCAIVGEGCREGGTDNNCLADGSHFCEDT